MMENLVYNYLIENNMLPDKVGKCATNSLNICNNKDIVLSGNCLGLIELADYILNVALSNVDNYHVHLDETNFFDDTKLELVILKQKE
jgi:hypothetical protein